MDLELHRERLHELRLTNRMGLDNIREFWRNPDIISGFRSWWTTISSEQDRLSMTTNSLHSSRIFSDLNRATEETEEEEEDFLGVNELAIYRIQNMVTPDLDDCRKLSQVGKKRESLLLDLLDNLVQGKENLELCAHLEEDLRQQIEGEISIEIKLFDSLSYDVKNPIVIGAIFDRLEQRFKKFPQSIIPYLIKRRLECTSLFAVDKQSEGVTPLINLIVESLPHTRTFSLTRFFACLINEFIQSIMIDAVEGGLDEFQQTIFGKNNLMSSNFELTNPKTGK